MARQRSRWYLTAASDARAWVRVLAERQATTPEAVRAALRTPHALARAVGRLIADDALHQARILVGAKQPPPDGKTLNDTITRRYYATLDERRRAEMNAKADAELERRMQK